jgi:hypothetical protein
MGTQVTRELSIGWEHADLKIITANVNWSDLMQVADSVPVNIQRIVILMLFFLAKSRSELLIFSSPWETNTSECVMNLVDGSCEITISVIDGLEQLMLVATFPEYKKD